MAWLALGQASVQFLGESAEIADRGKFLDDLSGRQVPAAPVPALLESVSARPLRVLVVAGRVAHRQHSSHAGH